MSADFRHIETGMEIPSEGYCDQPYVVDYHYSDSGFIPSPGAWWKASKEHRELKSAFLIRPNKNTSEAATRRLIALGYGSGAHERASRSGDYSNLARAIDLKPKLEGDCITLDIPDVHPWGVVVVSPEEGRKG